MMGCACLSKVSQRQQWRQQAYITFVSKVCGEINAKCDALGRKFECARDFWEYGISKGIEMMRVVPAVFIAQALEKGGDVILDVQRGVIVDIPSVDANAVIVFVSHRWWSSKSGKPDNPTFNKLHLLSDNLLPHIAGNHGVAMTDVYVWIDFASIAKQRKMEGICALPFYAMAADVFVCLRSGDEDMAMDPPMYFDSSSKKVRLYTGDIAEHPQHYDNRVWTAFEKFAATSFVGEQVCNRAKKSFLDVVLGPDFKIVSGPSNTFDQIRRELHSSAGWTLPPRENLEVEKDALFLEPIMIGLAVAGHMPRVIAAVHFGFSSAIRTFVAEGDNVNEKAVAGGLTGQAALHVAASQRNLNLIKALLAEPSIDPNLTDDMGSTALHRLLGSVLVGFYSGGELKACVNMLVNSKARVDIEDMFGRTPSSMANECNVVGVEAIMRSRSSSSIAPRRSLNVPIQTPAGNSIACADIDIVITSIVCSVQTSCGRIWTFRKYFGPPGAETILMLHSCWFDKDSMFYLLAPKLCVSLRMHVVCMDLPCCGGTSLQGGPLTYQAVACDLSEVIQREGWAPLHLAGVCLGCDICLCLHAASPEVVRSLTLIAFASAAPNPLPVRDYFADFSANCRGNGGTAFFLSRLKTPGLLGKFFLEASEHEGLRKKLFGRVSEMDMGMAANLFDMWNTRDFKPRFSACMCPTLLIAGKIDDWFIQHTLEAMEHLPEAQVGFLDRVGHAIPLEGCMETLRLMTRFLIAP